LFHRFDTLGSPLEEEGSLDYDGRLVHLQVYLKFNTIIHHQQAALRAPTMIKALAMDVDMLTIALHVGESRDDRKGTIATPSDVL
jgi:hypothetical protein